MLLNRLWLLSYSRFLLTLLFLTMGFVGGNAYAVKVTGLYSSAVPVSSQDTNLRDQAIKKAFQQVLIKLSGNSQVANNPAIRGALASPKTNLLSYNYEDGTLSNGEQSLFLNAQFDPNSVKDLLLSAGQTVWGQDRPLVLVFMTVQKDNGNEPHLVTQQTMNNHFKSALMYDAKLRGVPLVFPKQQQIQSANVKISTLANTSPQELTVIKQLAHTYNSDAVVTVNILEFNSGSWNMTWSLVSDGNLTQWQTSGTNKKAVLKQGFDKAADYLAQHYGTNAISDTLKPVQLTVTNVKDLTDYVAVSSYLKNLVPVKDVDLKQLSSHSLVYQLSVMGGELGLQRALSLDHKLKPVTVVPDFSNGNTGLVYQWAS